MLLIKPERSMPKLRKTVLRNLAAAIPDLVAGHTGFTRWPAAGASG